MTQVKRYFEYTEIGTLGYYGKDPLFKHGVLFHGTSMKNYQNIINNNYHVVDLYFGDDEHAISKQYAEEQNKKDGTDEIMIRCNINLLDGNMVDDYHGEERQKGQYIFTGNIKVAILNVKNITTDEIIYWHFENEKQNE